MEEENSGGGDARKRRRRPRRRSRGGRGGGPNASGGPNAAGERDAAARGPSAAGERDAAVRGPNASGERDAAVRHDGNGQGGERASHGGEARGSNGGGDRQGQRNGGRHRNPRGNGRSRPRRGRPAENWWARRWVEVLERFAVGRRLGRGRSYARQGNIVDIEIGKGSVLAHVQGSRDAPYLVRMHFSMLSSTDWKKITRALVQRPDIAVELGMGQIPDSIEGVFEEQNLSLFPNASGDLKANCSCPDNANPCKHVAAVYYLLGEEFDRDPFLIFQLRGMERAELMTALGPAAIPRLPPPPRPPELDDDEGHAEGEDGEALGELPPIPDVIVPPPERVVPDEPLPEDPDLFWGGAPRGKEELVEVRIPRVPGPVVARLGGFPFWRGQSNCEAAMARTYRNASIAGLDVYLGAGPVNEDES
jgi:uncharacterized Zn finger protein